MLSHFLLILSVPAIVDLWLQSLSADQDSKPKLLPPHSNVSYSTHRACQLDICITEAVGPHPFLVYIHGRDWGAGDKKQNPNNVLPFLKRGICDAAINSPHFRPQCMTQLQCTTRLQRIPFLRSMASQ
jgi:hypothetical protein